MTTKTQPRPYSRLGEESWNELAELARLKGDPRKRDDQCSKLAALFGKGWTEGVRLEIEFCRLTLAAALDEALQRPLPTHIRAEFDALIRDASLLAERMSVTDKLRKTRFVESVKRAAGDLAERMLYAPNLGKTRATRIIASALAGPSSLECANALRSWATEASLFCAHLCDVWAPVSREKHSMELGAKRRESGERNRLIGELTASHRQALRQIYRRDAERPTHVGERAYLSIVLFKTRRPSRRA